ADAGRALRRHRQAAADPAADAVYRHHAAQLPVGRLQEHEGGAEPHDLADAAADAADHAAGGEPAEVRAVAVRGALPGPEPDDPEGDPGRTGGPADLGDLPGGGARTGNGAVVRGGAPLPPGEAGDLRLSNTPCR